MILKRAYACFIIFLFPLLLTAQAVEFRVNFSKQYAVYNLLKKLSANYPANEMKQIFGRSVFNTQPYQSALRSFDSLQLYYTYDFNGYPEGQKIPGMTTAVLDKNLIESTTLSEFQNRSMGLIPATEIFKLSSLIEQFTLVYDSLFFNSNKTVIQNGLESFSNYVASEHFDKFFQQSLRFYGTMWNPDVGFNVNIVPVIEGRNFSARAIANNAIVEMPLNYRNFDALGSVMMHEIFHMVYDAQPLQLKKEIEKWFQQNPSKNSRYAYLLMNEALATAAGNGYVFKQLTDSLDQFSWYNNTYINYMAKRIYPLVENYYLNGKTMDKNFVDSYIDIYDGYFSSWINEPAHFMYYKALLTDNEKDIHFISQLYPGGSITQYEFPFSISGLGRIANSSITKIIGISSDNKNKLNLLRSKFPELRDQKFRHKKDFVFSTFLADKSRIIIINVVKKSFEEQWRNTFQ